MDAGANLEVMLGRGMFDKLGQFKGNLFFRGQFYDGRGVLPTSGMTRCTLLFSHFDVQNSANTRCAGKLAYKKLLFPFRFLSQKMCGLLPGSHSQIIGVLFGCRQLSNSGVKKSEDFCCFAFLLFRPPVWVWFLIHVRGYIMILLQKGKEVCLPLEFVFRGFFWSRNY